jgi:ABC-2 type transport system ATP-binding protein
MLFQGTLQELQQMKTKQMELEIETNDNSRAAQLLQAEFSLQQKENKILIPFKNNEQSAKINRILVQNGVDVFALHPQQSDLEQLFLEITSNN